MDLYEILCPVLLAILFPLMAYFSYKHDREREKDPEHRRKKQEKELRKRRARERSAKFDMFGNPM